MDELWRKSFAATAVAAAIAACHGATHSPPHSTKPAGDVTSHAAPPDQPDPAAAVPVDPVDAPDDRPALEEAIRKAAGSGGDLYLEAKTYHLSPAPRAFWCLDIPGGIRIHGKGQGKTVLQMAPGAGPSVRLLRVSGDDIALEDLTLDGNKAAQARDKQRHGIFAQDTHRLRVRRVTSQNFTGDGFYLYTGAADSVFDDVLATGNLRNGITFGSTVDGTTLQHSRFVGNAVQQVDSEPGGTGVVSNTTVTHCVLDGAGISNDYALTVSGTNIAQGNGWHVTDNTINGGIFVVWAGHVVIEHNTGVNPTTKPSVKVYRSSSDVAIRSNHFKLTQSQVRSNSGVMVQGTGPKGTPERVVITGNDIELTYEQSFGVRVEGARDVTITENTMRGAGRSAPGYAGIMLRATIADEDFRSAVVRGNVVRNFGDRGVTIQGNGPARLRSLEIRDNTFENDGDATAMPTAISLDDNSGAADNVVVSGNRFLHGVTAQVINIPPRAKVTIQPSPGARAPSATPRP